jgi:glycosyltransferase involved in cell wall biosynthesis
VKILIAAHINWYNAEAEYAHRLARGLAARGHRVVVWGHPGSPLLDRCRADGLEVTAFGNPGSLNPFCLAATLAALERLLPAFDIFNPHRSEGFSLLVRAGRRAGVRVARTRGDMRPTRLPGLNRRLYRAVDRLIVANDLLREELILRLGLDPSRVTTVHFGIRPGEVRPGMSKEAARRELGIGPEARLIGVMGRIGKVKGHEFALKAAEKVVAAMPSARFLLLYRDVEREDRFLPMLRRSPLRDKFLLAGPRPNPADLMQLCEVAVIPSVGSEAHCRVALEWMDLGVPVIGSRVGVIPEIVDHGVTGFLVQPRYSDTIADCILRLMNDPERARRMGNDGRRRLAELFTEDRMVAENLRALGEGEGAK